MRDETSKSGVHRDRPGNKPDACSPELLYLRPRRRSAPRWVKDLVFKFDGTTRRKLGDCLRAMKSTLSGEALETAIENAEAVVRDCIVSAGSGLNSRQQPRRKTTAVLKQVRKQIDKLERLREPKSSKSQEKKRVWNQARSTAALAKLLASKHGSLFSEVEHLLIAHGWPEYWDQRTMSCLGRLRDAVGGAQQTLDGDPSGSGGTALRAERRAVLHLAQIWVDTIATTAGRRGDKYGENVSPFAEFAQISLCAAGAALGTGLSRSMLIFSERRLAILV